MKKFLMLILLIYNFSYTAFSNNNFEQSIVNKLTNILIEEYDKYEDKKWIEKLVLKLGRPAYIDNINIWNKNFKDIENIKIKLHPKLEDMAKIVDENSDKKKSLYFRSLLEDLTMMGFKNLDNYYISVKEYVEMNNINPDDINIEVIEKSICNIKHYDKKVVLLKEEEKIKNELQMIMKEKELKYKMSFYSFAFNFLNKIRMRIVERELKSMENKINNPLS